ncbi:hypothetical protein CBR_g21858 [Chara braunii]|uniref:CCHC-type domain-containing protein n=1 Tax=Chara braunii TaxID=69332 RepID=A0A388JUM9_CHABU|nr:hypothetical protein CBR_g21858 [Chara braunii]|eukprot:GBG61516.1 hypothetical protein CBR_g21858 [Chara braunii]
MMPNHQPAVLGAQSPYLNPGQPFNVGFGGSIPGPGGSIPGPGGSIPGPGGSIPGTITCHICGKTGHYARNCWQAQERSTQTSDNDSEMREYFKRAIQREKEENERRMREEADRRRYEEEQRRESEKLREAEAREARLKQTITRLLTQQKKAALPMMETGVRKRSPRSKARMLREIRSYINKSDDDSDEVKEEASKLIDAIENRKREGKRRKDSPDPELSMKKKNIHVATIEEPQEELSIPKKNLAVGCSNEGMLEYALEVHRRLSAKKVAELWKLCGKEGLQCARKDEMVCELVRCKTRLAYEGFMEQATSNMGGK